MRIADGQALGGGAVLGQETKGDARHEVDGAVLESVGEAEGIAEAGADAGLGSDGGLGQAAAGVAIGLRVHQEGGASLQFGADEIEAALGLLPVAHHHVLELFVEELFRRLFELRVHFHIVGEHAEGLKVVRLALFERSEEALNALGGVGAMGEHLFERFLAPADVRDLGLDAVELAAQFGGEAAAVGEVLLGAAALAGNGFELHLALGDGLGKLLAGDVEAGDLGGGDGLFAGGAGGLAIDAGQVLFDLRQLVLEGGGLAEEAQNHLPAAFDGALALADLELQSLALLVDLGHALARGGDLGFQGLDIFLVAADLLIEGIQAQSQIVGILLVLRDALLDGSAFLDLRGEAPATAFGLHLALGQLAARLGELALHLVAGQLPALVRQFVLRHLGT